MHAVQDRVSPWPFVGMIIMACMFFMVGASILFLPWWLVGVLFVVWLAMTASACRAFATKPTSTLPIALANVAVYLVVLGVSVAARFR